MEQRAILSRSATRYSGYPVILNILNELKMGARSEVFKWKCYTVQGLDRAAL